MEAALLAVELAAGAHTLRFQGVNTRGGDHSSFIEDVRIATAGGTDVLLKNPGFEDVKLAPKAHIYRPPAITEPLYRFEGKVTTSGKAIYGRIVKTADKSYAPLESMPTMPAVRVNGRDAGALDPRGSSTPASTKVS